MSNNPNSYVHNGMRLNHCSELLQYRKIILSTWLADVGLFLPFELLCSLIHAQCTEVFKM